MIRICRSSKLAGCRGAAPWGCGSARPWVQGEGPWCSPRLPGLLNNDRADLWWTSRHNCHAGTAVHMRNNKALIVVCTQYPVLIEWARAV